MTRSLRDEPPQPLDAAREQLAAHCGQLFASLPRADQRRAAEAYISGLLRTPGKKSIRRIADESVGDNSDQSLQQFVNQSGWDPAPVRQRLTEWTCARSAPTAWVVGEVPFHKHGRHSAGVERQYVRSLGRLSNCQLGVFAAAATEDAAVPVTWRLALPRSWEGDELRRRKARVPDAERPLDRWCYEVQALDDLFGDWGAPVAPVLLDLRQTTLVRDLVDELADRGLDYILQVDASLPLRHGAARTAARPVGEAPPRRTISWRDPVVDLDVRAQFTCAPVHVALPGPHVGLVEWGLGKLEPRGFWLTNMVASDVEELVALTRLARRAERDIDTMVGRLGLCDYEGRSFPGWHHHTTLVSVAHDFSLRHPDSVMPADTAIAALDENPFGTSGQAQ